MAVFPENPCEFSIEFIRRMRKHHDIVQVPSSRQVLAIPKLILSRYYRKGHVNPNDYIEISTVTSFPDNQELAKDIAFEILFPNYKKDIVHSFFQDTSEDTKNSLENIVNQDIKTELDQLQDLIDEIEMSKSIEQESIQKLEEFLEQINLNRDLEPYKSALNFFNDDSELYKEEINSLEKLIKEAQERLKEKINSLTPEDLIAGANLNMNDFIQEKSIREWEKITSNALNNRDITEDLNKLLNAGKLEDLLESIKFLNETVSQQNIKDDIKRIKDQLQNQINNLDQLFNAAKTLGETPKFDKNKVLNNSLQQASFDHNFNLANSLDQYFGTNLRSEYLNRLNDAISSQSMNISLENLTKNAYANKAWNELFNKALNTAIEDAKTQKVKSEAFKALSHQLQQLMNSCSNMHCSQKISQKVPEIINQNLKACETPDQLRNVVEFLRKIGLNPEEEDIKSVGMELEMSEEEIYELIEPNYQLLKKMIEKNRGDFQRIENLMNQIKDQINKDRFKELLANALASDNRDALGALGHFNLSEALKGAEQVGGTEGQDKLISCLLIKQCVLSYFILLSY